MMSNTTKKALLIPLVILFGIFIGFQYEKNSSQNIIMIPLQESLEYKDLRTPEYLCEQIINHKKEYQENRPIPKNKNEEIVAYYEDSIANEYEKNAEVYEENGTVYINLDGNPKTIASHGGKFHTIVMLPKLSASKKYIAYQWCDEKTQSCDVIIEHLSTQKKRVLENAVSYSWHPHRDILVYDGSQKDEGHILLKSELYLYYADSNVIVELTDTDEFIETRPIFSEDGSDIYCDDAKTGKLLYFTMFAVTYQNLYIKQVKMYKTDDASLGIEEIKKHSKSFKSIEEDEKFAEKNATYWIEIELDKDMESGLYTTHTMPYIFDKISFTPEQLNIETEQQHRVMHEEKRTYGLSFNYKAGEDATRYYLRLKSYRLNPPLTQGLFKVEKINQITREAKEYVTYNYTKERLIETILSAIVIGMILMSALYTAIIYIYRRKKEFIYYTLMQVVMALFLFTAPGFFRGLFSLDLISMRQLTLFVAFFATLFTQSFLETKKYLPKIDMLLNLYLVLIIADAIWIFDAVLFQYKLYEFFGLIFLLTAMLRIKDGFRPAWFYLFGWIGLLLAIFLVDFYHFSNFTMFIGVFVEAVMLAWGLVYVSGFVRNEKL